MKTQQHVIHLATLAVLVTCGNAAELHVSITGNDANPGTSAAPLRTIQRAADLAQPGDTVTVHAGVYRERVNPPRGGESATKRIVYQAASGEQVVITGSEVVKQWEKVQDGVWKATLPNTFFGSFNPFAEVITGDWFDAKGRSHHAAAVYLNGDWLTEAVSLEDVLKPTTATPLWFASVDAANTVIWAQFKSVDPNAQQVEVNVRQTVFYPEKPGMNFITVRGFTLRNAATPWAPPTAEQVGLIGTHWSKGWIIENNVVSYSICSGISLGKYGDEWDNKSANSAEGYVKTIERATAHGWNKETIGHHVVSNNIISHCEQVGIVGSLGAAFSAITANTIHDIHVRQLFGGCEQAGIKIHGAIDVEIRGNRIYRAYRGMWMDWMGQGTRITGNLCYDNSAEDLYMEVNHGLYLVDNNMFLSQRSLWDMSEGGAFVHNLMTGKIDNWYDMSRFTPFLKPHATVVAGLVMTHGGDNRFFNNIFIGQGVPGAVADKNVKPQNSVTGYGLWVYDVREFPPQTAGNMYGNGARPYKTETNWAMQTGDGARATLVTEGDQVFLHLTFDLKAEKEKSVLVTTVLLGKAKASDCAFENPDGSPITIATDYFGKPRNADNPTPGPFEAPGTGTLTMKVWPLSPPREIKGAKPDAAKGFAWPFTSPADCPFEQSKTLGGIFFTGRHSDYRCGDTWYPCWASDGNLYSPWTDGKTDGVVSESGKVPAHTGHAVMIGDDPLKLEIHNTSPPKEATAAPYTGRYPAGSLVYNGIWYYGTYCLGPDGSTEHLGFTWNWPNLGPMPGFQISRDLGKTWEPSPHTPEKPLFPEPEKFLGPVKMGAPHFVDFGKNMEHSPDGKAYLIGMGAEENDPKPRPCIKLGKPGEAYQVVEGCTNDFAHANLSWVTADQAYLARVTPSPETINDPKAYEFFAGHDSSGQPVWTRDFKKIKPLVEWNNHMGCVTATYVPGLKKYLMCVTDGWPTVAKMTSYILEADVLTGPWRMVSYMPDFGEQGYFLNFPSKFISPDGQSLWLCYSANFSAGWNGVKLNFNPPGGRYGLCLHEVKLLKPEAPVPDSH